MKKRAFSALIAIIMLLTSFTPLSTFGAPGDNFPYLPYLDEDGYYYRIDDTENKKRSFNTDWDSMVDYFATELSARKNSITFDFASLDYPYTYTSTRNTVIAIAPFIYEDLTASIAALIGTDFYNIGHYSVAGYLNANDTPFENNQRYYPFTITFSSITYTDTDYPAYPHYNSSNKLYYRLSSGVPIAFNTDYDEMIEYFQTKLMQRRNTITYYFATTDEKYKYTRSDALNNADEVCEKFVYDVLTDVYKKDSDKPQNAAGGDYLFKSIKNIGSHGYASFLSAGDTPNGDNQRYYTFSITFGNISYFTSVEQENMIAEYCAEFSQNYIKSGATDYEKVKTIYDFVVRNTAYDYAVFNDKFDTYSSRYNIAHSAYGALIGSLGANDEFDLTSKKTVTNYNVISKADQGLAVCEGYSKLFYYLCVSNGIPCRIVDGDYFNDAGKPSDPHEWNYVWLDDGSGDGYKWFEVDTTFAAQKSFKEVDINNYDYFLCGRGNINFGYMNHQQPFFVDEETNILVANVIYDYWGEGSSYVSSFEDYQFRKLNLSTVDALKNGFIVRRSTDYEGEDDTKVALIYSTKDDQYIININDDGIELTDVHGFIYNGQNQSIYEVIIPYLDIKEYDVQKRTDLVDAGEYTLDIYGANNTSLQIKFNILPMDLDNSHEGNYEDETINVQDTALYTGHEIIPEAHIVDGYKNVLTNGKDYEIVAYKDANHTQKTVIKNIGTYYIDVNYEIGNNYSGHYYLTFTVNKVGMNQIDIDDIEFEYLPYSIREQNGIITPSDYYKAGASGMKIGDYNVSVGNDFDVSSIGNLSWDEKGVITLTGLSSSGVIASGSKKSIQYHVTKKFDISSLNGSAADTNTVNQYFYNGHAVTPVRFDHLDGYLVQGVDYVIDSYSNNVNAGKASVKIKGINGCSGTATMFFAINKAKISDAVISTKTVNGSVQCSLTYYGSALVKGKDYTETTKVVSTGYQIVITGINNFGGSTTVNVKTNMVKPTSSGNYVKLSATTYTYDGKAKTPTVTLYNKNKQVINGYYYTVKYSANKNVGTGKATITFRNGYSGTMTASFKINPKNTSLSSVSAASKAFTAKWKKYATQTTGYEIQYSTNSKFKSGNKTVAITKNSTTSKKVTKLKGKKVYYVRIRTYKTVSGKKYYSSWSGAKKVTTKK